MTHCANKYFLKGGHFYDGLGSPPKENTGLLIDGDIIKMVGCSGDEAEALSKDLSITTLDISNKWIMPGLIDGHCHLTFGHPDWGNTLPAGSTSRVEMCTLRAAENARKVLEAGVTGISVPGGAWYVDAAVRDAIALGKIVGPRVFAAGRFISTHDSIADPESALAGYPDHGIGVLANTPDEMVAEVRQQIKNGVDLIKVGDSPWGNEQTISCKELTAIVEEAHRRNSKVTIHARGAGSTRIAAEAGVDWIMHADFAREEDLQIVAKRGIPIMPSLAALEVICRHGRDHGIPNFVIDQAQLNLDAAVVMLELARKYEITLLCGSDTGNSPIMAYGQYHALEMELLVNYAGYTSEEAIKACTSDNALSIGLPNQVGAVACGYLADLLVLNQDPTSDFMAIHRSDNHYMIFKGGEPIYGENGRKNDHR